MARPRAFTRAESAWEEMRGRTPFTARPFVFVFAFWRVLEGRRVRGFIRKLLPSRLSNGLRGALSPLLWERGASSTAEPDKDKGAWPEPVHSPAQRGAFRAPTALR